LKPNQEVVFAIMSGAPLYNDKPQIVVGVVKSRNENGEITDIQPLTILHSVETRAGNYMNLNELYDAIYADYDSTPPDGSLYVFGGLVNPKTSKVFGKRPGIVRYNKGNNAWTRIDKITDYDPNAPIMMIGENNQPILLRGNIDTSKIFMPNIYEWSQSHYGRMYYLTKNGNDTYTPIAINKSDEVEEPITRDNIKSMIESGFVLSNARELRQVGVNFMFDPWNKNTGKFERILPSAADERKPMPKAGPQKVAGDAEFGDTTVKEVEAQAPAENEEILQLSIDSKTLDDILGNTGAVSEDVDYSVSYENQSGPAKAKIDEKTTPEIWNRWKGNEKMRKKLLGC
jgi:hypothetical protein